jgi:hypothetical protein
MAIFCSYALGGLFLFFLPDLAVIFLAAHGFWVPKILVAGAFFIFWSLTHGICGNSWLLLGHFKLNFQHRRPCPWMKN